MIPEVSLWVSWQGGFLRDGIEWILNCVFPNQRNSAISASSAMGLASSFGYCLLYDQGPRSRIRTVSFHNHQAYGACRIF
jgi:hypothetical protein